MEQVEKVKNRWPSKRQPALPAFVFTELTWSGFVDSFDAQLVKLGFQPVDVGFLCTQVVFDNLVVWMSVYFA